MRAEIDKQGVLHVIPESETEAYALSVWAVQAESTHQVNEPGGLTLPSRKHWRHTAIRVGLNWPPRLGDRS